MRLVELTPDALAAIASAAPPGNFRNNGRKLPNGNWAVPFDEETLLRLRKIAFAGETVSETMIRVVATQRGRN